ncbi:hypothetical protein AB0J28_18485 [Streptosporangium canum]|uniref:hypothetical protein n=1 Tax=Streptosporangium canum TaxID=324952 RepID=UPI0034185843
MEDLTGIAAFRCGSCNGTGVNACPDPCDGCAGRGCPDCDGVGVAPDDDRCRDCDGTGIDNYL